MMHFRWPKILLVFVFTAWFGVLLPGHESPWLSAFDPDGENAAEALTVPSGDSKDQDTPPHDCNHCALCQLAAHMTHAAPPPPLVISLLPVNHVFIARPVAHVPADVRRTSDSRGPPAV